MSDTDDTTPRDLPPIPTTPTGELSPAPAGAAEEPPVSVSLDVVTALHDRLMKLTAFVQSQDAEIASLRKSGEAIGALLRDQVVGQINDLHVAVGNHAELLDAAGAALEGLIGSAGRPPARGELPRRLPTTGEATAPAGRTTELLVDPTKEGVQTITLPGGQIVDVNVRRPTPPGGATLRDGKRGTVGGTRRS